jgi:hypothetical protein
VATVWQRRIINGHAATNCTALFGFATETISRHAIAWHFATFGYVRWVRVVTSRRAITPDTFAIAAFGYVAESLLQNCNNT